ncbi:MAG: hypothetical protein IPJ19_07505 [Planctomycetes bacterium]|nr:hypothetical protein [Planctomycetota bacterium]
MKQRILAALALLAFALVASAPAVAQKKKPTDPTECPYCHGDPEKMKAAGIVSHGPFAFGKSETTKIDAALPTTEIRWIETDFFRIGFGLREYKIKPEEKKKYVAELMRLKKVLPDVKPDTGVLDPWLRTHLFAQRAHDILDKFLNIIDGKEATFSDGSGKWAKGSYTGEGPYLGMKEKYEWLVLANQPTYTEFLTDNFGLQLKVGHREHNIVRGVLGYYCHAMEGQLRDDQALFGNLAFNLTHNFLDGLQHYNYDTPVWFHEGLSHWMERDINPKYNTFDSGEGGIADMTRKENWKPEVLKLINGNDCPHLAEMMGLKSYAEFKLPHHFTTWSMIDFLITKQPENFGKFIWALKGQVDKQGMPTGSNLPDYFREKFKEHFGFSYPEFEEEWRTWAKEAYKAGPVKGDPNGPINPLGGNGVPPGG